MKKSPLVSEKIKVPEDFAGEYFSSLPTSLDNNLPAEAFSEDDEFLESEDEGVDTMDEDDDENSNSQEETPKEKQNEQKQNESSSSEHDGKYFVIQKGICQCNQGFKFPNLKVTSHQKHYWNNAEGQADFLAVTEVDLTFNPPAMPFGNCKLKPSSGGYLPCAYAPAGKWTKTYEKVKVMGKSTVTELSELMCATGGKITVMKHGQQSEAGKNNIVKANTDEQQVYNPLVDFDEFKEEIEEDYSADYE